MRENLYTCERFSNKNFQIGTFKTSNWLLKYSYITNVNETYLLINNRNVLYIFNERLECKYEINLKIIFHEFELVRFVNIFQSDIIFEGLKTLNGNTIVFTIYYNPIYKTISHSMQNDCSLFHCFSENKTIFLKRKENIFGVLDLKNRTTIWEKEIEGFSSSIASNSEIIIRDIDGYKGKCCIDYMTGEEKWRVFANDFVELKDKKGVGQNFIINNKYVLGKTSVRIDLSSRKRENEVWFAIDIDSSKLVWSKSLPWLTVRKLAYPNSLYGIYLNEQDLRYYFTRLDLINGIVLENVDITEELIRIKDKNFDIYGLDPYIREMKITETHIYFGFNTDLIRMDKTTYEMAVILKGNGVLQDIEYINGRLFVNQMIADTYMFVEEGVSECEIDTFFYLKGLNDFQNFNELENVINK